MSGNLRIAEVSGFSGPDGGLRIAGVTGYSIQNDLVWNGTAWVAWPYIPIVVVPDPPGPLPPYATSLPQTIVEFDAAPPTVTEFVLDRDLLDGPQLISVTPRWVRVNDSGVLTVDITRGRPDPNSPVQAGECTIQCDNASGDFDPDNPWSAYNQPFAGSQFIPGMGVRVSVLYPDAGITTPLVLFTGRLETTNLTRGILPTAKLTIVDDLAEIGQSSLASFTDPIRPDETTPDRVAWLTNQAHLETVDVSVALGRTLLPTYGGGSILSELELVAAAEQGRVFCNVDNVLTVTAHSDVYTTPTIATLSDRDEPDAVDYEDVTTALGRQQVVNSVTVARYSQDGVHPDITSGDGASVDRYGRKSVAVVAPLKYDSDVQQLADYLATRRSTPAPTVDSVSVNFAGQIAAAGLLSAELGSQVSVSRTTKYSSGNVVITVRQAIEGIAWSISEGSFDCRLSLAQSDVASLFGSSDAFRLDQSYLNGPDLLVAY